MLIAWQYVSLLHYPYTMSSIKHLYCAMKLKIISQQLVLAIAKTLSEFSHA